MDKETSPALAICTRPGCCSINEYEMEKQDLQHTYAALSANSVAMTLQSECADASCSMTCPEPVSVAAEETSNNSNGLQQKHISSKVSFETPRSFDFFGKPVYMQSCMLSGAFVTSNPGQQ